MGEKIKGHAEADAGQAVELGNKIMSEGIKYPNQLNPYFNYMNLPKVTKDNVEQFMPGEW